MKIELITRSYDITNNIIQAIEGARFAKKSDGLSDSCIVYDPDYHSNFEANRGTKIGEKDLDLAFRLSNNENASGHDKFLQQVHFLVDISWSRLMHQEFDTYRIGISKQSESTMHTLTKDNLSMADFDVSKELFNDVYSCHAAELMVLRFMELRSNILEDKRTKKIDETTCRETLKRILPESFIQKRRVSMNYANMKTIYSQRKNHRNKEWQIFFKYMKEELPHSGLWTKEKDEN